MAAYSEFSVTATEVEAARQFGELVAVRIPDLQRLRQIREQRGNDDRHPQRALAVFAFLALLDLAAEKLGEQLHAVADAKHRHAEFERFFCPAAALSGHKPATGRRTG